MVVAMSTLRRRLWQDLSTEEKQLRLADLRRRQQLQIQLELRELRAVRTIRP